MRRLLYIIIGVVVLGVVVTSCENKSLNRQLTSDELMLCLLMRAGFSSTEIKRIMGKEKNRLTNMRADINLKLFGEKSASKLNNNLRPIF